VTAHHKIVCGPHRTARSKTSARFPILSDGGVYSG
jgi:hypothetical protein